MGNLKFALKITILMESNMNRNIDFRPWQIKTFQISTNK